MTSSSPTTTTTTTTTTSPTDPPVTRATILISGHGSNLQALIDATRSTLPYLRIVRVVSNKKDAYGLERARAAGLPTAYHNLFAPPRRYLRRAPREGSTNTTATTTTQATTATTAKPAPTPTEIKAGREAYDADLARLVLADEPDLVICAGWMHVLSPAFLDALSGAEQRRQPGGVPVINLHPALPGTYDGAGAIERAWRDFQDGRLAGGRTGIMIHHVIAEVDRGEPIVVREIECRKGESLEDLERRIHENEHQLIVQGTALAVGRLWEQRRARQSL